MFQRILLLFLILLGIGILVFRFSDAGSEIARRKNFFSNPFAPIFQNDANKDGSNIYAIGFPFPATPNIPTDSSYDYSDITPGTTNIPRELIDIEREYDELQKKVIEAQQFGNPSPFRGLVGIVDSYSGVVANDPALEYLLVEAVSSNTSPIEITGWSLQSLYSNIRVTVPDGARNFVMGTIPETGIIQLNPGEHVVLSSGVSPVGTSFKENLCTGYLGQFQTFLPSLNEQCPTPTDEVLSEPTTARTNDPACVYFARTIPSCRFYVGEPPNNVTSQCYSFVRNSLTYNGCVVRHRWRPSFSGDTWRVFLGASKEIWRNEHDVIRLLDKEGRVVDIWSY